jgi:hypothetical protein
VPLISGRKRKGWLLPPLGDHYEIEGHNRLYHAREIEAIESA